MFMLEKKVPPPPPPQFMCWQCFINFYNSIFTFIDLHSTKVSVLQPLQTLFFLIICTRYKRYALPRCKPAFNSNPTLS